MLNDGNDNTIMNYLSETVEHFSQSVCVCGTSSKYTLRKLITLKGSGAICSAAQHRVWRGLIEVDETVQTNINVTQWSACCAKTKLILQLKYDMVLFVNAFGNPRRFQPVQTNNHQLFVACKGICGLRCWWKQRKNFCLVNFSELFKSSTWGELNTVYNLILTKTYFLFGTSWKTIKQFKQFARHGQNEIYVVLRNTREKLSIPRIV